jgi:hypothetical protein
MPAAVSTPVKLLLVNIKKIKKNGERSLYYLVGKPAKYDRKELFNSNKSPTRYHNFPGYYPDVYYCSHCAPDDGRENARNMLSCK